MKKYLYATIVATLSFSATANWHNQAFSDFSAANKGIFIAKQSLNKGKFSSYLFL